MRIFRRIISLILLCLLLSWGGLYFQQDKLLFYPQAILADQRQALKSDPTITTLSIQTEDGATLQGWIKRPHHAGPAPVVVYFPGNAEEASQALNLADAWPDWAMVAFNYRSYGDSTGKPNESNMKSDALRVFDLVTARKDVDQSRVVLIGRSLGSGVAVALAAKRPVQALVLVTPYDSLPTVAAKHFPWVPTQWLMKNRFPSVELAPTLHKPALFVIAERDIIVPHANSQTLYQAWAGPKAWTTIANTDHGNIIDPAAFAQTVGHLLASQPHPSIAP